VLIAQVSAWTCLLVAAAFYAATALLIYKLFISRRR
jgi:hypothetical protein